MCSLVIERDELRMSRQATYMRQRSRPEQFEFTDDRFSRDDVNNATPNDRVYWTHSGHNGLSIGNTGKQSK